MPYTFSSGPLGSFRIGHEPMLGPFDTVADFRCQPFCAVDPSGSDYKEASVDIQRLISHTHHGIPLVHRDLILQQEKIYRALRDRSVDAAMMSQPILMDVVLERNPP
ncbi:hypothetical protein C8J57DRAFT_1505868 [Mycena rebaudengoi]|nr:hypothetical protein C8J57DRAFT_1505868 [Mycena rebaudengoi]